MCIVKHFVSLVVDGYPSLSDVCDACASILGKTKKEVEGMSPGECLSVFKENMAASREDMGGSYSGNTISLGKKIKKLDGVEIDCLILREPTMRHVMTFPLVSATYGDYLAVTMELTGIPSVVLKQLHMSDMMNVIKVISSFLKDGRQDGEKLQGI